MYISHFLQIARLHVSPAYERMCIFLEVTAGTLYMAFRHLQRIKQCDCNQATSQLIIDIAIVFLTASNCHHDRTISWR